MTPPAPTTPPGAVGARKILAERRLLSGLARGLALELPTVPPGAVIATVVRMSALLWRSGHRDGVPAAAVGLARARLTGEHFPTQAVSAASNGR